MLAPTGWCEGGMAVIDRRCGWDGRGMAGRLPALQAGAGPPGRPLKDLLRCGGRRPLRREGPVFVIASQCAHWRGNPYPPSPFSNVFKWQFENTTIIHFLFFIFHFTPSAYGGRGWGMAVNDRRYRLGRAGYGRQIAGATGGCGAQGIEDAAPYGGAMSRICHFERSEKSASPVP